MRDGQHRFTSSKSTLINMLTFEAFIADNMLADHSHDIMCFNKEKAFENVPFVKVIQELTDKEIKGRALKYLL